MLALKIRAYMASDAEGQGGSSGTTTTSTTTTTGAFMLDAIVVTDYRNPEDHENDGGDGDNEGYSTVEQAILEASKTVSLDAKFWGTATVGATQDSISKALEIQAQKVVPEISQKYGLSLAVAN